ncbi:hypothetical protein PEKONANI_03106 [Aeromonas jandaei]
MGRASDRAQFASMPWQVRPLSGAEIVSPTQQTSRFPILICNNMSPGGGRRVAGIGASEAPCWLLSARGWLTGSGQVAWLRELGGAQWLARREMRRIKKARHGRNASQLSLTGIVFIGFLHRILLWSCLHTAGVAPHPSLRQYKLPRLLIQLRHPLRDTPR